MAEGGKRTLKSKLIQIIVSTMLLTGVVTLGSFAFSSYRIEQSRLAEIEKQIQEAVSGKAATLVASHALALKGLVADNAFGDVRQLVASAVHKDSDLTYGLFLSAAGKPWAYVSPTHAHTDSEDEIQVEALADLQLPSEDTTAQALEQRKLRAFGKDIQEWSAVVKSEDGERLGTIIYGFSNARMHEAVQAAQIRSERALMRAFLTSFGVGIFCVLVGIAWVLRSSARITEPLATLTTTANEIATGKRGIRANIQSGDEIQVLASAFNQMLEANEDAMQKLEVTTERALAADRLKSEFLANMSHEIRTPMNGVLGMVKLIQTLPLDGKLARYVNTIDASANALLTIINDILDFSKMEAGKYTVHSVPFELHLVVQEVAELLASRAHDKHIELVHRTAPELPRVVMGDPDRFRQILNNLVGNAIKFTDRGEVFIDATLVRADEEGVLVRVAVEDTGIGIAEENLPKLYEAFSQVDGTLVRRHGGTGLGLAIVKRLVEMMGGEVQVKSEVGKGSTFAFTVRFGFASEKLSSSYPPPDTSRARKVLVVDENQRWRDVIQEHLSVWQMIGETRDNAARGLDCLRHAAATESPFDALVFSSDLSDMATEKLVLAIRREPGLTALPMILLSTFGATELRPEVQAELVAQLQKPLRFSELYDCLTGMLAIHAPRARKEHSQPRLPLSHRRVLVVDDNEINRFVVAEELERRGYQVDQATDGQSALGMFKSGDYLCILMDCQMPIMDGYQATRAIRKFEAERRLSRTPVIALTAHALVGERERVMDAGMDEFLSKPFRPSALEKLLRTYVKEPTKERARETVALDPAAKRSEKLIRLFLERVPEQLEALERALEQGDLGLVRGLAHKIKGSSLALAAEAMSNAAASMQHHAEAENLPKARAEFIELRRQHAVVAALLAEELDNRLSSAAEPAQ